MQQRAWKSTKVMKAMVRGVRWVPPHRPPYIGRERALRIPSANGHGCSPTVTAVRISIGHRAIAAYQKVTRRLTKRSDTGGPGGRGDKASATPYRCQILRIMARSHRTAPSRGELLGHQYTDSWRLRLTLLNNLGLSLNDSQEHSVQAFR